MFHFSELSIGTNIRGVRTNFRDFIKGHKTLLLSRALSFYEKDGKPLEGSRERELKEKKLCRNSVDGFTQMYLVKRMKTLSEENDWVDFTEILALISCGIVLFPQLNDYIDFVAIDVFLALRDRGENTMTIVLANTYWQIHIVLSTIGKYLQQQLEGVVTEYK